ncbi:glycosyltransferase family 2 protein [Frigoriflavimonas asaccharolytica]|uniref:GT2 family glycosyltransferase n=1 Tax=Frigoriflavimonas asaccharolytica TaxID=2735899 RepID=A0A8J8G8Q7_9FLAO|nr:glycosyltransferase family 2 protein [Frigoriflavimonas asaccharolytica]NRS92765.1 GT2 family glycosyltransferase [Frigoriflavimonas asaccharolytica]
MKVAIAILNYNGKNWLEKFLPTVIIHSQIAEIYVIDNASTDDSVAFLKQEFPEISVIINKKNYGFAGGYNEGLKTIIADIFCLLNSDVEVTANWISPIVELFEKDENIAAVQPKILSFTNREFFEFAGAAGGFVDNLGYPFCRGRIFENTEKDNGQYDDETEIFWASGCSLFIRSVDFWKQNGFDERFFAHQEEIDLCWRLKNAGRKIYYSHKSTIYHVGGGTLNKTNPRKTFLNFRNNLSMLVKNLPFSTLLWVIPTRLVLDGLAAIFIAKKEGFAHFTAVIKAHFAFYFAIPATWKLRGSHQIKNYYQQKWLVFKHFLGK